VERGLCADGRGALDDRQRARFARTRAGNGVFALHLLANFAWSVIFFGQHNIALALGDVVVMAITLAASIFLFARLRPVAAWLLAPVMAWVLFATLLNWQVLSLNPDAHDAGQAAGAVHVTF
jgi:tryptophan-rich sensory protein